MKTTNANLRNNRKGLVLSALFLAACMTILALALDHGVENHYSVLAKSLVVGTIADNDVRVVSRIDVIDDKATEELREANRAAVKPVYVRSATSSYDAVSKIDSIQSAYAGKNLDSLVGKVSDEMLSRIRTAGPLVISVSFGLVTDIMEQGVFKYSDLAESRPENSMQVVVLDVLEGKEEVVSTDFGILSDVTIGAYVKGRLSNYGNYLTDNDKALIEYIVSNVCQPNITLNRIVTEERRQKAYDETLPVVISFEKDQPIVEADTVITSAQIDTLSLLASQSKFSWADTIGNFLFCFLCITLCLYLFSLIIPEDNMHFRQYIGILDVVTFLVLVLTYFAQMLAVRFGLIDTMGFVPFMFIPLLMASIAGSKRVGYTCCLIISLMAVIFPGADVFSFFYWGLSSAVCVVMVKISVRRMGLITQWLLAVVFYAFVTVILRFIGMESFDTIWLEILFNSAMVSFVYLALAIVQPFLEWLFNLPTVYRLNDLAYGYSPILEKLAKSAPGTYNHSMAVSELAAVGAREIGANEFIARVGGLYHDIGKTEHPEYFTENGFEKKHDSINPSLSASIIKNHVSVGELLGKDARLPLEIVDIIANHHGNDVIAYFYMEAQKEQSDKEEVQRSDFTYSQAEIPSTRECAIVMLADSVEAASRSMTPNASKYDKVITKIFMDKIAKNQLDNSNLTLEELKVLKQTFINTLIARNHTRVEYPEEATSL